MALVIPFKRATGISSDSAWNASYTCMCGMISSLVSIRSLVMFSAEISVKPEIAFGIDQPGIHGHPGHIDDFAHLSESSPNRQRRRAVILPPDITSTPFSIAPCETVSNFPPLRATGFLLRRKQAPRRKANRKEPEAVGQRPTTNGQRQFLTTDD